MRVKDCMCHNVIQVTPDTSISEVAKLMDQNKVGCVPVCKDERIIGFVTDRDIIVRGVACNKDCNTTMISDIMNINVVKITPDTELDDAINVMIKNQIRRLPVIQDNKIVGMLTLGDLAHNKEIDSEELGHTLECICEDTGKHEC